VKDFTNHTVDRRKSSGRTQALRGCQFAHRAESQVMAGGGPTDTVVPVGDEAARRIRGASLLVAGQALLLVILAVAELASLNSGRPSVAITTAAFYLIFGGGLAYAAWGLDRHRSWSRGPVVLAQLISLGVGWSFRGGDTTWVTAVLAGWAVTVLVIVFSPSTTAALFGHRGDEHEV